MKQRCHSFWLSGSVFLFCLVTTSPSRAQIVPDSTLPNPSTVTPNGNTSVITGGTQAGSNLFHSFRGFSVPNNGVASFQQVDQGIENVISRVTGSSVSNINGLIEVLQANGTVSEANFFLLNPNGIIFGPNASLNMGGSFLASTASSLNFADGNLFSATNSQTTQPLLTVSVPIGLQFGKPVGSIQVQGAVLVVPPGKTLGLVGGDLTLVGGGLGAEGGRIELGSVTGVVTPDLAPVQVSIRPIDKGWALGYEGVQNFQDIQLSQQAVVNTSGWGGGDIQVQGRHVSVRDGSSIGAYTLGPEPGGTLTVTASESVELIGVSADSQLNSGLFTGTIGAGAAVDLKIATKRLIVRDGAQAYAATFNEGQGGDLAVSASDSVELTGESADGRFRSGLLAEAGPAATGAGGKLTIETGKLIVRDGAQAYAATLGEGSGGTLTVTTSDSVELSGTTTNGQLPSGLFTQTRGAGASGDLTIETRRLLVQDGAQVLTSTFGQGKAGHLTVQNATEVELVGGTIRDDKFISSGLFTTAEPKSIGIGGNLTISTEKLIVRDGAQVNSTTFAEGRAGDLTVRATDVELVGAALSPDGELLTDEITGLPYGSGLFAGTGIGSRGDGGTLSVETTRLSLRDGANLQTTTFGEGDAGNLTVQASESVELIGTAKGSQFPSSLLALSGGIPGLGGVPEAKGQGGNLRIETGELIVQDGAAVAVSSLNPSGDALGAGNLQVQAQSIRLENLGELTAQTSSGQGGNITLLVQDLLLLRRNSNISTTAGIAGAGGNGGDITIDTPFIVAVPTEDSNITANAFTGSGGRVQITTSGIFGIQFREVETPLLNDITASSEFGVNGVVEINTPDVDPSQGLVTLPTELVDASALIASGCGAPGGQKLGELIVTGRGGLPPNPSDTLSGDTVWSDLRAQQARTPSSSEVATEQTLPTTGQIVEATGWVINNKGEVVLTASAVPVLPHSPGLTPAGCHAP